MQQQQHQDPLMGWFQYVDTDRSGHIDQDELQKALTQSGITGNWKPFSVETCRLMIQMLDRDKNGTLGFAEFKDLWNILNGWKQVFMQHDADRSGFIDTRELTQCVTQIGYRVSPAVITAIAMRYSSNGSKQIPFDDFVSAIVRMRALTDAFMAMDSQRTGTVLMPYDKKNKTTKISNQFIIYRQDEAVAKYQGWSLLTRDEAMNFICENANIDVLKPDSWMQIAIAQRDTDELIGDIGLHLLEDPTAIEIGFSITRSAQGKGYGFEAVDGLLKMLFSKYAIVRVQSTTDIRNLPSSKLLLKLGMKIIKTHEEVEFKGETCVEQTYEMVKE
eukprot:CFRG2077T1